MKLKYYLRGVGIGLILAAIIMGIATRSRGREITDAEIMERARKLGMVEAEGTLTDYVKASSDGETDDTETGADTDIQTDQALSETGLEEGTEENEGEEYGADNPVSQMVQEEGEGEDKDSEESPGESAEGGISTGTEAAADDQTDTTGETAVEAGKDISGDGSGTGGSGESAEGSEFVNPTYIQVSIPKGVGSDTVCAMLERAGLVESASAFNNYLIVQRKDRIIRTGNKSIPTGASFEQIAGIITAE